MPEVLEIEQVEVEKKEKIKPNWDSWVSRSSKRNH